MKKDYTHIAMVVDRSGSMSSCWEDVLGGYKQLVIDNKKAPGKCTFTVAAFDTEYDTLEDFTDIQSVNETLKVSPRGGTALLDAIGKTITLVGEKLAKLAEDERPEKVMFVIQTDGYENASKEFKKDAIKKMITDQTEIYKWEFMFIGASLDAVHDAQSWGIRDCNTSVYNTNNSAKTFSLVGEKMTRCRGVDVAAYSAACSFTDDEKKTMAESKSTATVTK
jgi:uncharacterized protein YegL